MSEFTIIETQEQLDAVLKERLKRERETQTKKYEGWVSPEELKKLTDEHAKQIEAFEDAAAKDAKTIAAKDEEIANNAKYRTDLEKTRIALAAGLKIDYADRLKGETEEEWKADAEVLAKDFAATHRTAPLGNPEGAPASSVKNDKKSMENAAFKSMLSGIDGNN